MRVIGIDPGATGALVVIGHSYNREIGNKYMTVHPFKKTNGFTANMEDILYQIQLRGTVFLENVHSFPGQGSSSTFTFGVNTGRIQGLILSAGNTWTPVTPMAWQKELGLVGPYTTKVLRKQAHVKKAKELFPEYAKEIKLDTADAILIAEYGYRKEMQKEGYHGI